MNILTYVLTMPTFNCIPQTFRARIPGQNVRVHNLLCSYSLVYTRVLTRVQLTSSREPSSNPPMDVG